MYFRFNVFVCIFPALFHPLIHHMWEGGAVGWEASTTQSFQLPSAV